MLWMFQSTSAFVDYSCGDLHEAESWVFQARDGAGVHTAEILIVVGILGGLMAFIITAVMNHLETVKRKETVVRAQSISQAVVAYQMDWSKAPSADEGLTLLTQEKNGKGPYVSEKNLKDAWGNDFSYELTPQGAKITSAGKDGSVGTDDDIVVIRGEETNAAETSSDDGDKAEEKPLE